MKKILSLTIPSALMLQSYCFSQATQSINSKYPNHIYIGPEAFAFTLHTHVKDVKIRGTRYFVGPRLRYEYLKPEAFYAGFDLFGSWGNKGFKSSSHKYHFHEKGGIGFGNFELRMGYAFAPKRCIIAPYIGFGLYGFGNTSFNEILLYATTGMRSLFEISNSFSVGLNFKLFFAPRAEQRFKYHDHGHTHRLKEEENMWGTEIGVPLVWYLGSSKRWEIQLEPYFLKLDFSEVQNIYGTRLLFGYRF